MASSIFKLLTNLLFLIGFSASCFAFTKDKEPSNSAIFNEIERNLIFSKQNIGNNAFYESNGRNSEQNAKITIGGEDVVVDEEKENEGGLGITVTEVKASRIKLHKKESLAYNSASIGQYEVAIELYKDVLSKDPKNHNAKFALATIYQKIHQLRQAKILYYQLLKTAPELRNVVTSNLLTILVEDSPKDAAYMLSRLSIEHPKSAFIAAQSSIAYDKMDNARESVKFMERAVRIEPNNLIYRYNLAVLYDKSKNYTDAVVNYSKVIKNYDIKNDEQRNSIPVNDIKERISYLRNMARSS